MIEKGIKDLINANATLNSYLGGRIYQNEGLQGANYPQLIVLIDEQTPIRGQIGICAREYYVLMHSMSKSYADCRNIGEELIKVFDRYNGQMDGDQVSGAIYNGTVINVKEKDGDLYHIGYEFKFIINNVQN